jgi:hypothetical protein
VTVFREWLSSSHKRAFRLAASKIQEVWYHFDRESALFRVWATAAFVARFEYGLTMTTKTEKWERRVQFEPPREITVMSIDGTWCAEAVLLEASDKGARIRSPILRAELAEFFLLLTRFGKPVFRRCTRTWINGPEMGVTFAKSGSKPPNKAPPEENAVGDRAQMVQPQRRQSTVDQGAG